MDVRWGARLEGGLSFPYAMGSDTVYRAGCSSCTWNESVQSHKDRAKVSDTYVQGGRSSPAGFSPSSGVSFFSLLQNVTAAIALSLTTEGCSGLHLIESEVYFVMSLVVVKRDTHLIFLPLQKEQAITNRRSLRRCFLSSSAVGWWTAAGGGVSPCPTRDGPTLGGQ
jgi:hypothetical protein